MIIAAHTAQHFLTIETLARKIVPDFYEHFFARATAEYLVEHGHTAEARGLEKVELFVLRRNKAAVGLYKKYGFICAAEVMTRLGNGAVLDDYLMRKIIEN